MRHLLEVVNSKAIHASVEEVWDALTNPRKTRIYMFGCAAKSDWKPGSPLSWEAEIDGNTRIFVTGKVLAFQIPHLLQYTVFDPNSDMEDIPENHLRVTYQLTEAEGLTMLTIRQDGFENAARGQERYEEVYNKGIGWEPILNQIAAMLEGEKS